MLSNQTITRGAKRESGRLVRSAVGHDVAGHQTSRNRRTAKRTKRAKEDARIRIRGDFSEITLASRYYRGAGRSSAAPKTRANWLLNYRESAPSLVVALSLSRQSWKRECTFPLFRALLCACVCWIDCCNAYFIIETLANRFRAVKRAREATLYERNNQRSWRCTFLQ